MLKRKRAVNGHQSGSDWRILQVGPQPGNILKVRYIARGSACGLAPRPILIA